ncbi:androglobin-like [Cephus cinctus]|uniref:Androglobin-like n=1 Tax=Cephus cinctus TaxID=211228 RepID=A0AAJ7RV25_CEPCN|nr:androglobin-like [Cephus cinctus]
MSLKSKKALEAQSMIHHPDPIQSVLWPQWLDSELNTEKWESPKNGPDGKFQDTQPVIMPASLKPHAWERATKLTGLTDAPVVYVPTVDFPDFIENNKHILHSEVSTSLS